jgi:hypothetical protein
MTDAPVATHDPDIPQAWAGILDPGETIRWQGRPVPKLRLEFRTALEPLFFIFFTGFSVFWMVGASQAGGLFWTFGLLFFFIGSYSLFGQHFWKYYLRLHSHYTLTNRRAFIATEVLGKRRLRSYPIGKDTVIDLVDGSPGSVFFATEITKDGEGDVTRTPIGFELVEDSRSVYALIREIQSTP